MSQRSIFLCPDLKRRKWLCCSVCSQSQQAFFSVMWCVIGSYTQTVCVAFFEGRLSKHQAEPLRHHVSNEVLWVSLQGYCYGYCCHYILHDTQFWVTLSWSAGSGWFCSFIIGVTWWTSSSPFSVTAIPALVSPQHTKLQAGNLDFKSGKGEPWCLIGSPDESEFCSLHESLTRTRWPTGKHSHSFDGWSMEAAVCCT